MRLPKKIWSVYLTRNWTKILTDAHLLAVAGHTPFKLTCVGYGYTVIEKGTTSGMWKEVSREA
jgi:hypothetical protein